MKNYTRTSTLGLLTLTLTLATFNLLILVFFITYVRMQHATEPVPFGFPRNNHRNGNGDQGPKNLSSQGCQKKTEKDSKKPQIK